MIDAAVQRIPLRHRFTSLYILVGLCALAAVCAAAYLGTSNVIRQTRTVHVEKSWGTPTQTLAAAQISPQLVQAGMTVCDYYASRNTLICH